MGFNKYYKMTSNDYYQNGRNCMDKGDYKDAAENFTKAIELTEKEDAAKNCSHLFYQYRAECYEKMKQYDKAVKDEPRISYFIMMNRFEEALDICNYMIENHEDSFGYIHRANCYKKMKEYKKAIDDYTQAIQLIKDEYSYEYEEFYHLRALCYQEMNKYDNALKDHSEAIKRNRRHKGVYPDIYFKYRADCYREISEHKKADADYERAINRYTNELEDKVTDRYYYEYARRSKGQILALRANCYKSMGKISRAIEDYTKLIEIKVGCIKQAEHIDATIKYYSDRGDCYRKLKQYNKAIEDYTSAIELSLYNNEDYIKRADCYVELKKYDSAISDYTKAIEIYPYDWKYYYDRAKCLFKLGEYTKMRDDCNYLLNNPDNKLYDVNIRECKILYEKLETLSNKPAEIKTCTKQEIMSVEGITLAIADKFIELRNNGAMWYNIETFARDFKIEPHQIAAMQDRLIFPLKPSVKTGRRIDF